MRHSLLFLTVCLGLSLRSFAAVPSDPNALLKAAEYIRNPQEDYSVKVTTIDVKDDKKDVRTYETLIQGRTKALVRYLSPVIDKGTKVLMVEDQMWVHMPSSAKPLKISPRQKLAGNAAYGDVVRLNFTDNYSAKILGPGVHEGTKAIILDLTAIDGKPVTYDKVEYWIDAKTNNPLKAVYKTIGGKTLREGYFKKYEDVFGVKRPTLLLLVDFLEKKHITELVFSDSKKGSQPDLLFEKQNFGRDQ